MLTDIKQTELDLAEEKILTALFNTTVIPSKADFVLKLLDININKTIQKLETGLKAIMNDKGLVDCNLCKAVVATEFPLLSNMIPAHDFRWIEVVDTVEGIINVLKGLYNGNA